MPIRVPFHKAHGAGNDFLFTFTGDCDALPVEDRLPALARAICDRNRGVGADGWYLVDHVDGIGARIRLWNCDGSKAELSGNGTRCAAAVLSWIGGADGELRILTGAGPKTLKLLSRRGASFEFEMNVGAPRIADSGLRFALPLGDRSVETALIDVGNPQCALITDPIPADWKALGAEIEPHPHFPNRTNVSFLRAIAPDRIEARFYERGAGPTLSSGTGATGAAVAALALGLVSNPVTVETEGGALAVRWDGPGNPAFLTGPAEVVAQGVFIW